jgi:hypothetical protein
MAARDSFHAARGPRLPSVLRIVAALMLMPHGAQKLFGSPAGPPPQHPPGKCQYKTVALRRVYIYSKEQRRRLSFSYDLKRLAAAMKRKRGYEVSARPDGNEVRITRTFGGMKYNIIFEGGEPLSFNVFTDRERCATPDRLLRRRAYRMIGDLPLGARQKAELEGHVMVVVSSWVDMPSEAFPHPPPARTRPADDPNRITTRNQAAVT